MKRWALRITPYHFEIQHAPEIEMTDVDILSRDPKYFRKWQQQACNRKYV
jgi:hypothetical protein